MLTQPLFKQEMGGPQRRTTSISGATVRGVKPVNPVNVSVKLPVALEVKASTDAPRSKASKDGGGLATTTLVRFG